jgi:hypothetical protein
VWRREKRAIVEARTINGVTMQHVIGWVGTRHCGCKWVAGRRLDRDEPTFGALPCDQHGAQNARAMDVAQHMPPQAEAMSDLWERTLDGEIEIAP